MNDQRTDSEIDGLVDAFLEDDYRAIDPDLQRIKQLMASRGAGRSWHKHGTFKDHILGTYRALVLWGQPREVCLCGLLHNVYSNEYADLALFDPHEGRQVLRDCLGAEQEEMIHLFCTMPRNAFVAAFAEASQVPRDGLTLRAGGTSVSLTRERVAAYLVITVADLVEQWHSWQEDTMTGYPRTDDVDARALWIFSLWPGPLSPGSSALSLASKLASHLPSLGLPVPPIFDRCTRVLEADDEAAANALYWQAATVSVPLVSPPAARHILLQAIRHNPWVAEPHLLLAQLAMIEADFETAAAHADRGYRLCRAWGVPWDKRVSWQGWTIWARMLRQKACGRSWPQTLEIYNSLGLVNPSRF